MLLYGTYTNLKQDAKQCYNKKVHLFRSLKYQAPIL